MLSLINGIYFLIGVFVIIVYDFCIGMINAYFNKKRNHIDIEIRKNKLFINGNPVDNVDIHIEN